MKRKFVVHSSRFTLHFYKMFIDIDCSQMKKYNQNAYGDYFISKRYPDEAKLIVVLSDGLGSGIKANILSCMTATMLLKFIEGDQIPISKAAEIIMNSLPVCQVRKISYSTFSAIEVDDDGKAKIVEEGNPKFIWMRDNEVLEPQFKSIPSKTFKNRCLKVYKIQLKLGDRLIFCSDGVTQSGLGGGRLKLGLRREDVRLLAVSRYWHRYRLPKRLIRWTEEPVCLGQKQKGFLLYVPNDSQMKIEFNRWGHPEFDDWLWVSYWYPVRQVVAFKRDVYRRILTEFAPAALFGKSPVVEIKNYHKTRRRGG